MQHIGDGNYQYLRVLKVGLQIMLIFIIDKSADYFQD